jgi:biopolymer transport protein ExbD
MSDAEAKKIEDFRKKQAKKKKRAKAAAKAAEEGGAPLSLNSMMDMFTIILVFLIKSFGSQPLTITSDTDLPYSIADFKPKNMTVVFIGKSGIVLNGQPLKPPLTLDEKLRVRKEMKKGGETGMIINPLELALQEEARVRRTKFKDDPALAFKGELIIVADAKVPYRTIAEVLQTAIVNEYKSFKFAVYSSSDNMALSGRVGAKK